MFDGLGPEDPVRTAIQGLVNAGAAFIDRKAAGSPFAEALAKVKSSSNESARAQTQLYHQRNNLKVAREKVQKLEELVTKCEQESKAKMDEANGYIAAFEKHSIENNLKSLWSTANEAAPTAAAPNGKAQEEIDALRLQVHNQAEQLAKLLAQMQSTSASPASGGSSGGQPVQQLAQQLGQTALALQGAGSPSPEDDGRPKQNKRYKAGDDEGKMDVATDAEHEAPAGPDDAAAIVAAAKKTSELAAAALGGSRG